MTKKIKKLVLHKSVISSLSKTEADQLRGGTYADTIWDTCVGISCGAACTYVCGTRIIDGCSPGYSEEPECSFDCSAECYTWDPYAPVCQGPTAG